MVNYSHIIRRETRMMNNPSVIVATSGRVPEKASATPLACVGFSLEEERVMQHRCSKYFLQFENLGINPVAELRSSPKYLHKHKRACTQRYKGVVNPFKINCQVRCEGGKCNEVKV